jgi:hypothetical protein
MINVSQLEEAQALVRQRKEIVERLKQMNGRDKGWEQGLLVSVGYDTIFGNNDTREHEEPLDFTEEFHNAAAAIAQVIERYLRTELVDIESSLQRLGVEIEQ